MEAEKGVSCGNCNAQMTPDHQCEFVKIESDTIEALDSDCRLENIESEQEDELKTAKAKADRHKQHKERLIMLEILMKERDRLRNVETGVHS